MHQRRGAAHLISCSRVVIRFSCVPVIYFSFSSVLCVARPPYICSLPDFAVCIGNRIYVVDFARGESPPADVLNFLCVDAGSRICAFFRSTSSLGFRRRIYAFYLNALVVPRVVSFVRLRGASGT